MTLEWLIPLKTFVLTFYFGASAVIGYALSLSFETGCGWGWAIATLLAAAVILANGAVTWTWLDELIQEAQNER